MDGNDDENDEQEAGEGLHEEQEPQTREELRQIQARFKNNRRTAAHFYSQRYVQIEMRMIYLGAQPLFEEFQKALEEQEKGQVSSCPTLCLIFF